MALRFCSVFPRFLKKNKTDRSLRFPGVFKSFYQHCTWSNGGNAIVEGVRSIPRERLWYFTRGWKTMRLCVAAHRGRAKKAGGGLNSRTNTPRYRLVSRLVQTPLGAVCGRSHCEVQRFLS